MLPSAPALQLSRAHGAGGCSLLSQWAAVPVCHHGSSVPALAQGPNVPGHA